MELTRQQIKLLKFIIKPKTVKAICKHFHFTDYDDFKFLLIYQNQPLFEWECEPVNFDTHLQATYIAISYIENIRKENIRFSIPVLISIISLVVAILSLIVSLN